MKKTSFDKLINAIEKQASSNVFTAYIRDDTLSEYIYIFNEYAIIRLDASYYKNIQGKKAYLPPIDELMQLWETNNGITYRKRGKHLDIISMDRYIEYFNKYFNLSDKIDTFDANISYNNIFDNGTLPKHYFYNTDAIIAVNADIHDAIMQACYNIDYLPYCYGTTNIQPIIYCGLGLQAAVLPIRIDSTDSIAAMLYNHCKPQILKARNVKKAVPV